MVRRLNRLLHYMRVILKALLQSCRQTKYAHAKTRTHAHTRVFTGPTAIERCLGYAHEALFTPCS